MLVHAGLSNLALLSIHSWENVRGLCTEVAKEMKTTLEVLENVLLLVQALTSPAKSLCPFSSMSLANVNLTGENSTWETSLDLPMADATLAPVPHHLP